MRTASRREVFPVPVRLARRPDLWVVDDFLSEEEIAGALARMNDPRWVGRRALHTISDPRYFATEVPADGRGLFGQIARRVERTIGVRSSRARTLRFKYNESGQGHALHSDACEHAGHHVVLSHLIYLNDVDAGGATQFPHALPRPVQVVPRRGRLIFWNSLDEEGRVTHEGLHGAAPITRGEKAVLVGFTQLPRGETVTRVSPSWPAARPARLRG